MAKPKQTAQPPAPAEPTEISWTIRMPGTLKAQINEHVAALNLRGKGRWSGNSVVVAMLEWAEAERAAGRGWEP